MSIEHIATIQAQLQPPKWNAEQLAKAEKRAAELREQINRDLAYLQALQEAIYLNRERESE